MSASLEFLVAGVILVVPTAVFSSTMVTVTAAHAAAQNVAQHGAHTFALAASDAAGQLVVKRYARLSFADYGVAQITPLVEVSCDTNPCHERLATVTVTVSARVPILGVPGFVPAMTVPVHATATEQISRLWSGDADG